MVKIAIVTDSTSDLPISVIEKNKIRMVPLKVNFQDQSYTEGLDITNKEFYEKLEASDALPTTSQPSPADFAAKYQELIDDGYDSIISVHISDKLSGTRQSALLAGDMVKDKLANFVAIDSKHVSASTGLIVQQAAEMVLSGLSFDEVVESINMTIDNTDLFVVVDTLKYLEKGGRIGKGKAMVGSLLNIKPVLTMNDGSITDKDKARTRKKGMQMMLDFAKERQKNKPDIRIAICHSQVIDEAVKLESLVKEQLGVEPEYISEVGSVVGTHIGPGALFLAYY